MVPELVFDQPKGRLVEGSKYWLAIIVGAGVILKFASLESDDVGVSTLVIRIV